MGIANSGCAAIFLGIVAVAASADEPLSAIDWLSQSVAGAETRVVLPAPQPEGANAATAIHNGARAGDITVTAIDGPALDALGILPGATTGLPNDLWGATPSVDLARLIRMERIDTLPAIQSLLNMLLLAELSPPRDASGKGELFLARVDKLLDLGALDGALSLLELPDAPSAEPFRRWFDVALLLGLEHRACATMITTPEVAPTFPARIFCLARDGDWTAAALSCSRASRICLCPPGRHLWS